jgi:hypothetical protein
MSPTKTHITGVRAVSIPVEKQDDAASQSKATSAATKPSNARCRAAPASTSSGKESCSVTDTTQSHHSRALCQSQILTAINIRRR